MSVWKLENALGQVNIWYSEDVIKKIESYIDDYKKQCDIPGNCVDKRLCSTCFLGGALELGEEILDVIKNEGGHGK